MTVMDYALAMEEAMNIGEVFDIMIDAEHDSSLSEVDLDYLVDVENRMYDSFN